MLIFDPYRDKLAYVINYQKVHFLTSNTIYASTCIPVVCDKTSLHSYYTVQGLSQM